MGHQVRPAVDAIDLRHTNLIWHTDGLRLGDLVYRVPLASLAWFCFAGEGSVFWHMAPGFASHRIDLTFLPQKSMYADATAIICNLQYILTRELV